MVDLERTKPIEILNNPEPALSTTKLLACRIGLFLAWGTCLAISLLPLTFVNWPDWLVLIWLLILPVIGLPSIYFVFRRFGWAGFHRAEPKPSVAVNSNTAFDWRYMLFSFILFGILKANGFLPNHSDENGPVASRPGVAQKADQNREKEVLDQISKHRIEWTQPFSDATKNNSTTPVPRSSNEIGSGRFPTNAFQEHDPNTAESTAEFWAKTVVKAYRLAFDNPAAGITYKQLLRTIISDCQLLARQCESTEKKNVDPELVSFVSKQARVLREYSDYLVEMVNLCESKGISLEMVLTEEAIGNGQYWTELLITDRDSLLANTDPKDRQVLEELAKFIGAEENSYVDTLCLQAKLEERYPTQKFALPEITPLNAEKEWNDFLKSEKQKAERRVAELRGLALPSDPDRTRKFWDERTSPISKARFMLDLGATSPDTEEQLLYFFIKPALDKLSPVGSDAVDVELVEMFERHANVERQLLDLWKATGKMLAALHNIADASGPLSESTSGWKDELILKLSKKLEIGEELTEIENQFIADRDFWIALRSEQHVEVLIMQARMRERHKGVGFSLD